MDGGALLFLNDSTYVYCSEDDGNFYYHRGRNCDEPRPLSDLDPEGYFGCGPPDAAVENVTHYLLFKGLFINSTPK